MSFNYNTHPYCIVEVNIYFVKRANKEWLLILLNSNGLRNSFIMDKTKMYVFYALNFCLCAFTYRCSSDVKMDQSTLHEIGTRTKQVLGTLPGSSGWVSEILGHGIPPKSHPEKNPTIRKIDVGIYVLGFYASFLEKVSAAFMCARQCNSPFHSHSNNGNPGKSSSHNVLLCALTGL